MIDNVILSDIFHQIRSMIKGNFNNERRMKNKEWTYSPASTVRTFFVGFEEVVIWDWGIYDDIYTSADKIEAWCKENCEGYFMSQIFRVSPSRNYPDDWEFDDMGGHDKWFWAFELEKDATLFSLRW